MATLRVATLRVTTLIAAVVCAGCAIDDAGVANASSPSEGGVHAAADRALADDADSALPDEAPASPASVGQPNLDAETAPVLDAETALALAAMPLSCLDRPHALRPDRAGYIDDVAYTRRRGFERERAFYGCWDWHSAVNSTWAMVRLLKALPALPVGPLIREKLRDHLSARALQGELEYLTANPSFERPYGWAWLLFLHAELASWDDEDAATWAARLTPVIDLLNDRLAAYLEDLEGPVRTGTHPNTAFAIAVSLQAASMYDAASVGEAASAGARPELHAALRDAAVRFFGRDRRCPTAYEPGRSDFVSPCLEEAALMGMVMERAAYVAWLEGFLPPLDSDEFATLRHPVLAEAIEEAPSEGGEVIANDSLRAVLGARSHLIGLAFSRADAMLRIARALPADDSRVERLRELAEVHAQAGFETMFDADYAGSHWIGSFAVKYLAEAMKGDV